MATLRTVTKNTLLYTFSTVLQRASSIIFFPIFSFYLTQGDYGIQSVAYFVTQFVTIVCGLELTRTATRFIHEGGDVETRAKEIYGSYVLVIFGMNALVALALYAVGPWVMKPFLNDIPFFPYVALTVSTLPFVSVYVLFRSYLQATHQGVRFVKIDFTYFLTNVGLNVLFVAGFRMGVKGILLSSLISAISFSAFAYFAFYRHTQLRINREVLRAGLRFSLPLVPFILAGVLLEWTDKMVLNAKLGKDAGGILYIATMMAAFFSVLRESCNQALIPWFYQQYDKHPVAYTRRVIQAAFGGLAILAVCISWFSYELLALLSSNDQLVAAYKYTPVIVNTALVVFLSQIFNMTVMYFKTNARFLSIASVLALPVSIGLSVVLIDSYGIFGAVFTNFAAMSTMTIGAGVLSHRSGFKLGYAFFAVVCLASLGLSQLMLFQWPLSFWSLFAAKAVAAAAICTAYYLYLAKHFPINALIRDRLQPMTNILQRMR